MLHAGQNNNLMSTMVMTPEDDPDNDNEDPDSTPNSRPTPFDDDKIAVLKDPLNQLEQLATSNNVLSPTPGLSLNERLNIKIQSPTLPFSSSDPPPPFSPDSLEKVPAAAKALLLWKDDVEVLALDRAKKRSVRGEDDFKKDISPSIAANLHQKGKKAKNLLKEKKWMIHPHDKWKMYWDTYCGLIIFYSVLVIPYRICFNQEAVGFTLGLDYVIDFSFFLDMAMSFRTGYFTKSGHLTMNKSRIASSYLRSWFTVDFLSTVPLDTVLVILMVSELLEQMFCCSTSRGHSTKFSLSHSPL